MESNSTMTISEQIKAQQAEIESIKNNINSLKKQAAEELIAYLSDKGITTVEDFDCYIDLIKNEGTKDKDKGLKGRTLYTVERLVKGAMIDGHYFSESLSRNLNLHDGAKVELKFNPNSYLPYVTIKEQTEKVYSDNIVFYENALVETDGYGLHIKKSSNGDTLETNSRGTALKFRITTKRAEEFFIKEGSLVDIGYDKSELTSTKEVPTIKQASIVWVNSTDDRPKMDTSGTSIKDILEDKAKNVVFTNKRTSKLPYSPRVKYDLDGKSILIVGGRTFADKVSNVTSAHNGGDTFSYDSKEDSAGTLDKYINQVDAVVLTTTNASHFSTQTTITRAKEAGVPVASVSTLTPLAYERAVYRAIAGLPSRETTTTDFQYPAVETK